MNSDKKKSKAGLEPETVMGGKKIVLFQDKFHYNFVQVTLYCIFLKIYILYENINIEVILYMQNNIIKCYII